MSTRTRPSFSVTSKSIFRASSPNKTGRLSIVFVFVFLTQLSGFCASYASLFREPKDLQDERYSSFGPSSVRPSLDRLKLPRHQPKGPQIGSSFGRMLPVGPSIVNIRNSLDCCCQSQVSCFNIYTSFSDKRFLVAIFPC